MEPTQVFSPLLTRYDEKYEDRPRMELMGLLDFPFRDVLEIGCGGGATGGVIKRDHPEVTYYGVEIDADAAGQARRVLDRVLRGDIESMSLEDYAIPRSAFDLIILADVLEHLYDPWKVLRTLRDYLRPGGVVVASIPNAQNIRLVQSLVNGFWTYAQRGLLDATHIRFFTLVEIGRLFSGSGFMIDQLISSCDADMPTAGPWPRDLEWGKLALRGLTREDVQQLYTFQYLVRARRTSDNGKGKLS
ncbi:MAG: class I SAM-dependent methyltransferase [Bacteroidetes bacterium]|nr:class I SAM-dependent methyltransferase [Bacteroidota bacterium]